jgi:hypothetical protein
MKHIKLLSCAILLAISLVAFPAEAGAEEPVFCTVQESPCPEANRWATGTELDFSILSGGSATLRDTEGNTRNTCTGSTAKGKIEKAEGVTGPIETLTWSGCTFTTTTVSTANKFEVLHIAGTHNGTVRSDSNFEITFNSALFGSCIFGVAPGVDLGELKEGNPARLVVNTVVSRFGNNTNCPKTTTLSAEYTLTEPKEKTLSVETVPPPVFCTVQESPCKEANRWAEGTELDLSLKSGTSAQLSNTAGTESLDKCTGSTAKGKIEKAEAVTGSLEALTWSGCSFETTTTLPGKFEVERIAGTHNGTVKADTESRVTINGGFFGSCLYGAGIGTDLGELKEGKPASFVVNAVVGKISGSATVCPETARWTAEYTVTEPKEKTLSVESGTLPTGSVFCTVQESPCPEANRWATGTELDFSLKSGISAYLKDTSGNTLDTCTGSTAKGKLEKDENVTGPVESLTWSGCSFTTTTLKSGELEVEHIAGTHNGTVKADDRIEVTINIFGGCIYGFESGAVLGELKEGKPAIFVANAIATRLNSCLGPKTAKWSAEYTLTEPKEKTLSVEVG